MTKYYFHFKKGIIQKVYSVTPDGLKTYMEREIPAFDKSDIYTGRDAFTYAGYMETFTPETLEDIIARGGDLYSEWTDYLAYCDSNMLVPTDNILDVAYEIVTSEEYRNNLKYEEATNCFETH